MAPKKSAAKAEPAAAAPAAAAAARPAVDDILVPATKRPCVGEGVAGDQAILKKPVLPAADRRDIGSRDMMKVLVPWVLQELPKKLKELKAAEVTDLKTAKPLTLPAAADASGLTSYKEPWVPKNCVTSCLSSGVYEAGGNLMWIDPEATGDTLMPCDDVPFRSLMAVAQTQFPITANEKQPRIRFPIPLQCWWRSGVQMLPKDTFPSGGLAPLGGHAFIWGWYLAVFLALEESDFEKVKLLYQCALTTTVCMFTTDSKPELALESIRMAETIRTNAQVSTDNFVIFTQKVMVMVPSGKFDLKDLVKKEVRYQGGIINQTMVQVMKALQGMLTSEVVMQKLEQLDREFGKDVLTGSYNKLKLFLGAVKGDTDACAWVLETMIVALQRREVDVNMFMLSAYQKSRNGDPNFMATATSTRSIVNHLINLADGVAAVDQALATTLTDKVTSKLSSPSLFNAVFPASDDDDGKDDAEGGDNDEEGSGVQELSGFMESLSNSAPKGAVLLAECMKKCYEGGYSQAISTLANSSTPDVVLQTMSEDEVGPLAKDVAEIMKAFRAADQVVGMQSGKQAPKATLRELVRQVSNGGDAEAAAAEREDVWRRATAQRKKLVTLVTVKNPKARTSYQDAVNKVPVFGSYQGKLGESHRVFVLTAELLNQKGKTPWMEASTPDDQVFAEMCAFLTAYGRGPCDVVMAFDGGMRKCRRMLEDTVGKLPSCAEIIVVYSTSWNGWIKKKYFLSSEHTECGYVAMASSKNRQGVKARAEGMHAAGEKTTHWTSLTGVAPVARCSLPRVTPEDKAKIFPEATDELPARWSKHVSAGVPMFWGEMKSVTTWASLLDEVNGKCCVDLSPGSGALASACIKLGIPYLGIVGSSAHMTWLTNVVDRAALKYICESGNCLYQEDLATHLKELFQDVVEAQLEQVNDDAICMSDAE